MSTTHDRQIGRGADAIADWRRQMALAELDQAIEFDAGKRDGTFYDRPTGVDLIRRRAGAVMGCVRTALKYLRPVTLQDIQDRHIAGVCHEPSCPQCNPEEWD